MTFYQQIHYTTSKTTLREIVSTAWLNQNLSKPNLIILDASLKGSAEGKAFEKFNKTIPNARIFDLKNVFVNKTSPFPNTIPEPEIFETACRQLGINQDSEIVVFDNNGIFSSPRVWWLFMVMGHDNIAVLNGGLPNWIEKGFRTENKHIETFNPGNFIANFNKSLLVDFEHVLGNIKEQKFTLIDARSESRFNGIAQEPRKHLKSGNIENSINIPYQEVLKDGKYKSKSELCALFDEKVKDENELVFTCGSGMTACIVLLACQIGYKNSLKLYDGSWTEWAERNKLLNDV